MLKPQSSFSKAQLLITTIQKLSMAKSHEAIRDIVKQAARELVGSDGATFVLRDKDHCYYVDEDAIAPLWKGQRFPMRICISGWVMSHKKSVVIPDIYLDERIPTAAYQPTFVKSLVMVPIRAMQPIGAIGNYWQTYHEPTAEEVQLLEALADSTSIAMENVNVYLDLENRIQERTHELELINKELEAFSYSVSHDLKTPLRAINGYASLLLESEVLNSDEESKELVNRVLKNTDKMNGLIKDLLNLSHVNQVELNYTTVNVTRLCETILKEFSSNNPSQKIVFQIDDAITIYGDERLLRILFQNLLSNAWKFLSKTKDPLIQVKKEETEHKDRVLVIDNGVGFDMQYATHLFEPFKRLHAERDFPGTGIGLAIVKRIMNRHHGEVSVSAAPNQGASFVVEFAKERV